MGGDLEGSGRGLSEVMLGGTGRPELCQTSYWTIQRVATLCCRLHVSTDYFPVEGWRNRSFHRSDITILM
jgi:hypothetical protein